MLKKRFLAVVLVVCLAISVVSAVASANIPWSITPIDTFNVPAGNLVNDGDFPGYIPPNVRFTYDWDGKATLDTANYLTGNGAILIDVTGAQRGRFYLDVPVDGSKKYKVGFVVKTEDVKLGEGEEALQWGLFFKDALGAWVNFTAAAESLPEDYFNSLQSVGIAFRTPPQVDLGSGLSRISGTNDWFQVEIVLDLPTLAKDFQAGLGMVTTLRLEQILYKSESGKVWVDSIYVSPVQ